MGRKSGILLHISSLPSRYGIGTLGKEAYRFIDFLVKAKQKVWQMLPLGPTGYGDSPYQSFSVFAGNPYFIDLDMLKEDNLLTEAELEKSGLPKKIGNIDYGILFEKRIPVLKLAFNRGYNPNDKAYISFVENNAEWLYDYSFFAAIKDYLNHIPLSEWPLPLKTRDTEAMHSYGLKLEKEINLHRYIQYLFFKQYTLLKDYAAKKGILLFGDLPFYPSPDSSDVWSWPQDFQLDQKTTAQKASAGVPPDYFSEDGQVWGNPLYNWEQQKIEGYRWWLLRFAQQSKLYDMLRIDHFRGLHTFFSIPYKDTTARNGHWEIGPGIEFVKLIKDSFPNLKIVAEDLGDLDEGVKQFVKDSGLACMYVYQFAFDSVDSNYLPHNHNKNAVVYTGTHDNDTLKGFLSGRTKGARLARRYFNLTNRQTEVFDMIRIGMSSVADLFIAPIQDYLELPGSARLNTPSTTFGNWQFRIGEDDLSDSLARKIAEITLLYSR